MRKGQKVRGGNSHDRAMARAKEVREGKSVTQQQGIPTTDTSMAAPDKKAPWAFGDSVTVSALLVGIVLVVIVPPLYVKAPILLGVCGGFIRLIWKSHWTYAKKAWEKMIYAVAVNIAILALAIPQFRSQWRDEHPVSPAAIPAQLLEVKSRCTNLSSQIFELLLMHAGQTFIPRADHPEDLNELVRRDQQTVLLYERQYQPQVRRCIEDMHKAGINDERLEGMAAGVGNSNILRTLAEHLQAQAERITPQGIVPLTRMLAP